MKKYGKGLAAAVLALGVAGISLAEGTLETVGETQGRTFHADLYADPACVACHGETEPSSFPADDVCLDCHDQESVVAATARAADEKWQNPHDNLHYGQDVPCMECHGEHESRKPLCEGCHSFEYPNHES